MIDTNISCGYTVKYVNITIIYIHIRRPYIIVVQLLRDCNGNPVNMIDPWGLEAYYIFYNDINDPYNGCLKDRVEKEYNALIKSGVSKDDIYIMMITTEKQFLEEWAKMSNGDNPILGVALYLHSSPRGIIINADTGQSIVTQMYVDDTGDTSHKMISDLAQKRILEINLYGCNTAHLDYYDRNVAYELMYYQPQVNRVVGWDGSMRWGFFDGKPKLASSQDYFNSWRDAADPGSKRKPQGRIVYERQWVTYGDNWYYWEITVRKHGTNPNTAWIINPAIYR